MKLLTTVLSSFLIVFSVALFAQTSKIVTSNAELLKELSVADQAAFQEQQELEVKYNVKRGERPPINIKGIDKDAYESGKLVIKLQPYMADKLPDRQIVTGKESFVITGVESLDMLNKKYNAQAYKPMFSSLYNTNEKTIENRERHRAWGFHLWFEIEVNEKADILDAVKFYSALPEVAIAEPVYKKVLYDDGTYEKFDPSEENSTKWTPNDPMLANQWHYNNTGQQGGTPGADISLFPAWDIEKGHTSVIVSIQDGGIQINHTDLAANMWSGIGYNFVTGSSTITVHDHGVHVAGTVAAVNNNNVLVSGVAGGSGSGDGVRLMSSQVFTTTGAGGFHLAPVHAADNGAAISQNSWGYTSVNVFEQNVLDAIDYFNANGGGAVLNGGITIYAAGNSNATGNWYPGCYSGAFAVAATNNQDIRSYYSNYGAWVDVSAPGGETTSVTARGVLSTISTNSYAYYQGTSMACPHTSGVAALIVSYAYRNGAVLDNTDIADILRNTTDDHYGVNGGYVGNLGTGRLNAHNALLETQAYISGVFNPQSVTAATFSMNQINISWTKNSNNNNVMLVWSADGTFGAPVNGTTYSAGNTLPGGGTVLYRGTNLSYNHTGLNPATTYYYRAYSYDGSNEYSSGRNANATTLCDIIALPHYQSFETGGIPPLCWSTIDNDGDGHNWLLVDELFEPYDGSFAAASASYDNGTGTALTPDNWLISPQFAVNSDVVELKFHIKAQDPAWVSDKYSVLVSTTGNNVGDFTPIHTEILTTADWKEVILPLSGYNGQNIFIAFRHWDCTDWFMIVLDNIIIEEVIPNTPTSASNPNPINNQTGYITSGNLTWDWGFFSDTYDLYFGVAGSMVKVVDNGVAGAQGTQGSFAFNDILEMTDYQWQVISKNITSGLTASSPIWNFRTACGAFTSLPFNENFNASTSIPECWAIADNQGSGEVWQFGTHTGGLTGTSGNYAYLDSDAYGSGSSQNTDLISPVFDFSGYTNIQLDFTHYFREWTGSSATLSYSINGGASWTVIQSWTTTTPNPTTFSQIIAAVSEQSLVRFKWNYTGSWGYYWDVDDISITGEALTGVPNPIGFNAMPTSSSQIDLAWNKNASNDNVMIAFNTTNTFGVPSGSYSVGQNITGGGTIIYRSSGETFNHIGLNANTTYYYKAWSYDGTNVYSNGVTSNATTQCGTMTLPFSEGFEAATIPLCWSQEYVTAENHNWLFGAGNGASNPAAAHEGSRNAYFKYSGTPSRTTKLVTPRIDLSAFSDVTLNFHLFNQVWAGDQDVLRVYYKNSAAGSWVLLNTYNTNITVWTAIQIIIPNAVLSDDFYIAFEGEANYGYGVCIDAASITGSIASIVGDVNGDGNVNILDVVWMVSHLNGSTPVGFIMTNADVNGDTIINVADLTALINLILNIIK